MFDIGFWELFFLFLLTLFVLGPEKLPDKDLVEKHHSTVPDKFQDLVNLPGVGSKTARVVLNTLHKQPYVAVDTHVFRVSRRIGLAKSENVSGVEKELEKKIPTQWILDAHHWIILHGRYICKARKPLCSECPISEHCKFFKTKNLAQGFPN